MNFHSHEGACLSFNQTIEKQHQSTRAMENKQFCCENGRVGQRIDEAIRQKYFFKKGQFSISTFRLVS